jgi:hypothetical protein
MWHSCFLEPDEFFIGILERDPVPPVRLNPDLPPKLEPQTGEFRFCREGIPIKNAELTVERSLRAETMQGDRTALAKSEAVEAGCTMPVLDPAEKGNGIGSKAKPVRVNLDVIRQWFNYGQLSGLGQWRNGSFGRFGSV